ncbi:HEPN domain-containing protein [archaeon]|jgi:hypothetical protein|nr:HEPN domain-containing protein [archaeon]MBT4373268.1 HEPN domain-containing protein [archaeon]MBT4531613.1 HEPN domain-containing protein [archaeon]MBT7001209.1 HEPN domain-containing protein [archaeon]MBT7282305.1 HEPN domain-containing protein [archaeon]
MERIKKGDKQKALSLIKTAEEDLKFTLTLSVSKESSNTIIRNIYESFRMMGESILVNKGIKFSDHVQSINELLKLKIQTSRPLNLLDSLRKLRHKINYNGHLSTIEESKEAISIARSLFDDLKKEVEKIIN